MTKRVRVSSQIIDPLHPILSPSRLEGVEDIIITSGRSGSKSSAMAINVNMRAISKPSAHVMMRKNHNKLESTVYKESLRAFSRLGLTSRSYKAWKRPMKIRINQNGSMIYFTGSDNPDDTKGMIDDDFNIETVTIDEVNEFFKMGYDRGKEEIDNIKATFVRGNNEDNFKMFYMFNPPRNPKEPVMKWLEEKKYIHDKEGNRLGLNPRTLHLHVTYKDVPVEWNGQGLINSALETKRVDEEYYRWLWLGETVGVKDVIYYMFDEKKHVVDYNNQRLTDIGIGIDYGHGNATTFNAFGIDRRELKVRGILGWEHSGRKTGQEKTTQQYALDFREFVREVERKTGQKVQFYSIDPSASGLRIAIQSLMPNLMAVKANNSVNEGIELVQSLTYMNAITYDSSQKGLIEEKHLYSWDEKSLDAGNAKPIKDNDHHCDGERYYFMTIRRELLNLIPLLREGFNVKEKD